MDKNVLLEAENDKLKDRLYNLSDYYHECNHLIGDLKTAFENIEDSNDLEITKSIASKALALIVERRDDCTPNLYPNGEYHTGHSHSEYLNLRILHKPVFESRPLNVAALYNSLGINT